VLAALLAVPAYMPLVPAQIHKPRDTDSMTFESYRNRV
jgi:hypothetical protein